MFANRRVAASVLVSSAALLGALSAGAHSERPAARRYGARIRYAARPTARSRAQLSPETPSLAAAVRHAAVPRSEFISVDEIKPGMKGYGLTVFRGTKIERFGVDVIDVLRRDYMGRDMILIRTHGPIFDKRKAMVIGGMSGSPIYINGRLAGAYSMGYNSMNEPVAMVTPIAYMLEAWSKTLPQKPLYTSISGLTPQTSPTLASMFGDMSAGLDIPAFQRIGSALRPPDADITPAPMTFHASGLSAPVLQRLNQKLNPYGMEFEAVVGGGHSDQADKAPPIQPGSAFGFAEATGDVELSNGGTVTYRRGNRVLTLGHPGLGQFGLGPVEVPLSTAYVADVLSNMVRSTKLQSMGKVVGSLVQDTPYSSAGVIGRMPHLVKVTVNVDNHATGQRRTLRSEVMKHPLLTSSFIESVADEAVFRMQTFPGDVMAKVQTRIDAAGLKPIVRNNAYYAPFFIDVFAMQDLDDLLTILTRNDFGPVDVKDVTMNVDIVPGRQSVRIERAFVDRDKVEPGDTVQLGVVLRPWRKEPYVKTISLKVPDSAPDGRTQIVVANGATPVASMPGPVATTPSAPGAPPSAPPTGPMYRNVQQMIDRYLELGSNTDMAARLFLTSQGVNVMGERLYDVPAPIADVLRSPRSSGYRPERDAVKRIIPMDAYVIGGAVVPITIQRNSYQENGRTTARPAPQSPAHDTGATSGGSVPSPPASAAIEEPGDGGDGGDGGESTAGPAAAGLAAGWTGADPAAAPRAAAGPSMSWIDPALVDALKARLAADDGPEPTKARRDRAAKPSDKPSDGKPDDKKDAGKSDAAQPAAAPAPPAPGAGDQAGDKKDEKKEDKSDDDKTKGPGRTAVLWTLKSKAQFERGDGDGVGVTTVGDVRLAPTLKRVQFLEQEAQVWSMAPDGKGGYFLGTGNLGRIYHLDASGKLGAPVETPELAIRAMAAGPDGTVYAGGWPTGTIYKLEASEKPTPFVKTDAHFILALATDKDGNLYASASPDGRILKITPDGKSSVLFKAPEGHILCMALDHAGNLIAGTSDSGVIYKITPGGRTSVLYDPDDNAVTSLLVVKDGDVYAGTSPKGRILHIHPDGATKVVYDAGAPVMALEEDPEGHLYAGAGTNVYRLDNDEIITDLDTKDQNQILGLDWVPGSGLWAVSGNLAAVYHADDRKGSGEYLSPVHDTQNPSHWGRISWLARLPKGASATLETRTGNAEEPDETWSPWSRVYGDPNGSVITSPPARYIQYRAHLAAGDGDASPEIKSVTISYLPENRPPSVSFSAPAVADVWSGKQTIRWSASDPDKDTLTYDLYYSADGGHTWKPIDAAGNKMETKPADNGKPDVATTPEVKPATAKPGPQAQDVLNQLNNELNKDKTLSPEDRALLDAILPSVVQDAVTTAPEKEIKPDPAAAGAPAEKPMTETSYAWDTSHMPDGQYFLKIVASDKRSNPSDPLTDDQVLGPITVVNSKPTATISGDAAVKDRVVTLAGTANGIRVPISTVSYRVDKGDWAAAEAVDGLFDSPLEQYRVVTDPLSPGDHTIEVRVTTIANLNATAETKVTVK